VEHCRLRADKREDCLSDSEFRSARSTLKRTETPQANTVGCRFFWLLFFRQVKKSHSPIKGEIKNDNSNGDSKRTLPGTGENISRALA
ncbi:MAG: hypothetical protein WBN49_10765, partial [Arenicellales bacterium]